MIVRACCRWTASTSPTTSSPGEARCDARVRPTRSTRLGSSWRSGGSASFGFNGNRTSAGNRAPTDFKVNGVACVGPNRAPTVSVTSPANNTSYTIGQAIPLAASAADSDGSVSSVEFYAGTTRLGADTTAPYEFSWTGATAGEYSVTARAVDNLGAATVSSPIAVRVLSAPAVVATPSTVRVRQGDSATVGVKLATQPSGSVSLTVARTAGSTDLTATPTTLTFNQNTWNTTQNVTVASAANGGALASATFSITGTGLTAATLDVAEIEAGASDYRAAFLEQYNKIKDPASGYFRDFSGLLVPYHSVETLLVEAPDHGHQTTSEAFSYYLWLEAAYGQLEGDWAPFNQAWASMEKFIIPSRYGDVIRIETQATEIRRSSFDIQHRVYKGEALAIEARETRVWAGKDPDNAERIKGYPIPDEVVAALKG